MGNELRLVAADWEHPKDDNGKEIPLWDGYNRYVNEWDEGKRHWDQGETEYISSEYDPYAPKTWIPKEESTLTEAQLGMSYEEYAGERPKQEDYMPDWPEEEKTHYQMYTNTTGPGVPFSPVMESREALAQWLAENDEIGLFGGEKETTYDDWLSSMPDDAYIKVRTTINATDAEHHDKGVASEVGKDAGIASRS